MFYLKHMYMSVRIVDINKLATDYQYSTKDGRKFHILRDGDAPSIVHVDGKYIIDIEWVDSGECVTIELQKDEQTLAHEFGFILPKTYGESLFYEISEVEELKSLVSDNDRFRDASGGKWIVLKRHRNKCIIANDTYTKVMIITPQNMHTMFDPYSDCGLVWEETKQTLFVSDVDVYDADDYDIPPEIKELSSCCIEGVLKSDGTLHVSCLRKYDDDGEMVRTPLDLVLHDNMLDFIRTKRDQWL